MSTLTTTTTRQEVTMHLVNERAQNVYNRFHRVSANKRLSCLASPLLVATFIEDGLRVLTSWKEQMDYMQGVMGMWYIIGCACLLFSAATQLIGSAAVLRAKDPRITRGGCYGLLSFLALQPFMYGQAHDTDFMCRTVTLAGGLLMLIWSENERQRRLEDTGMLQGFNRRADQLQLSARVLLALLFIFQSIFSDFGGVKTLLTAPSFFGVISSFSILSLAGMVCVGYQTQRSSVALAAVLAAWNFVMHPFWAAARLPPGMADYYRFFFFQTLSIIGGLMLLAKYGAGGISFDSAKFD